MPGREINNICSPGRQTMHNTIVVVFGVEKYWKIPWSIRSCLLPIAYKKGYLNIASKNLTEPSLFQIRFYTNLDISDKNLFLKKTCFCVEQSECLFSSKNNSYYSKFFKYPYPLSGQTVLHHKPLNMCSKLFDVWLAALFSPIFKSKPSSSIYGKVHNKTSYKYILMNFLKESVKMFSDKRKYHSIRIKFKDASFVRC